MDAPLTQRLHQLQLYCKHRVNHLLTGHYKSLFKGQGLEFDEVRAYTAGDDVRAIDWNVTARTGDVHVRRFHEERELNLLLVVDNSPSFAWSSQETSRQYIAAQFCGLLGTAAITSNDRIGLLKFSSGIDEYLPPARGNNQLMRCLESVLDKPEPVSSTSLSDTLEHINLLNLKRSVIVVISDFLVTDDYLENLAILARHHEVIPVAIDDPRETLFEGGGLIRLKDSETGGVGLFDLSSKLLRQTFRSRSAQRIQTRQQGFSDWGLDLLCHKPGDDPVETLLSYFMTRKHRVEGESGG